MSQAGTVFIIVTLNAINLAELKIAVTTRGSPILTMQVAI